MTNTFIGKQNKLHTIESLEIVNILKNKELLTEYNIKELDVLYKKYFGSYIHNYPLILKEQIKLYDKSSNINSFIYKNQLYWFDKNTRACLLNLANYSEQYVELVLGNNIINISPENLKKFLAQLEVYASKCYVNTQKHLLNINQLRTVEDLINYDYTIGYPDKIILNE